MKDPLNLLLKAGAKKRMPQGRDWTFSRAPELRQTALQALGLLWHTAEGLGFDVLCLVSTIALRDLMSFAQVRGLLGGLDSEMEVPLQGKACVPRM